MQEKYIYKNGTNIPHGTGFRLSCAFSMPKN